MNNSKTVWVIDDDEAIREVTKVILETHGLNVVLIEDEVELEKKFLTPTPSLILLDIRMNGTSGVSLAAKLKTSPTTQSTPILLVSGDTDIASFVEVSGANSYIRKPFEINDLLSAVDKYLQ